MKVWNCMECRDGKQLLPHKSPHNAQKYQFDTPHEK